MQLLRFAAKIMLDRLVGEPRTDEAIDLFREWATGRDAESRHRELAEAKREAADPTVLERIVRETMTSADSGVGPEQRDRLAFALASGFSDAPGDAVDRPLEMKTLVERLLPGKAKTFVIWLNFPTIVGDGPGRYYHFNWDGESWRVRDYIGGQIMHPPDRQVADRELRPVALDLTALQIWNQGEGRIHCRACFGLSFAVTKMDDWRNALALLTETARLWQVA